MNKKIIYEEVLKLGAGTHRKGFELIVRATEKVISNPTIGTINLYNELAKEFNDTSSRVERGLRYYVECIMHEGNKDEVSKLILKVGERGVPTVTEFIRVFALYLKMNFN